MPARKITRETTVPTPSTPVNGSVAVPNLEAFQAPAPPTSVAQDFDLDSFRATPGPVAVPVESGVDAVRVEKPRKGDFVYVHPDWRDYLWIILGDFRRKRDAHLVAPNVAAGHLQVCRKVLIVPYCDIDGNYFLWPIPQEDSVGRINEYNKSAMRQVVRAAGKWCQFEANLGNQTYNLYEALEQREAPKWPPEGLPFLIRKAFEDRIMTTPDHPIFQQTQGRKI